MVRNFRVRHAVVGDAPAIATVHVLSWQSAYRSIVPSSVLDAMDIDQRTEGWENALQVGLRADRTSQPTTYVVEGEHGVVGFATVGEYRDAPAPEAAELWAMYVHPKHTRSGAGAALMDRTLEHFGDLRATIGYLWVLAQNTNGRFFYEKERWSVVPESEAAPQMLDMDGEKVAEVLYSIELGPSSPRGPALR